MSESGMLYSFDLPENPKARIRDMVRLKPYGVSLLPDPNRPILLLKDDSGGHTLPVNINPLEAGVALTQFNKSGVPVTPHKVTEVLLQSLDIRIEKCVFVEIKTNFQYVRLYLKNHPHLKSMKLRAEEVMSLCLHLNVDIYATPEFMLASRELNLKLNVQIQSQTLMRENKGQGYIQ
jgi:hypothetical protein